MNIAYYIAKRYTVSFSKNTAINIITGIATLGIMVSSMALFVVLSAFSGLKDFSLQFTNQTDPDIKVFPKTGKSFVITSSQEQQIKSIGTIASFSKTAEERVLFYFNGKEIVAYLKGVDSLFLQTAHFENHLYTGTWLKPQTNEAVVGVGISQKLGMGLFDFENDFRVMVPKAGKGTIETLEQGFMESILFPTGIYVINEDLDSKYVFCNLGLAQQLLQFKANEVSNIEVRLTSSEQEKETITKLNQIFNSEIIVKNRAQLNDVLYKMLNSENIAVYLIFTLVIIIALFNLVGAIIMMIIDKKKNLKTLYSLGVPVAKLKQIFLFQGILLTLIGGSIGLILGAILVYIQLQYQVISISQNMPYPVQFSVINIVIVGFTITFLGFLASYVASSQVTKKLVHDL